MSMTENGDGDVDDDDGGASVKLEEKIHELNMSVCVFCLTLVDECWKMYDILLLCCVRKAILLREQGQVTDAFACLDRLLTECDKEKKSYFADFRCR